MILALLLAAAPQVTATPAPDWDALFDRDSGWTGADGIYSIPLDSNDGFYNMTNTRTLFVFSDTFIGNVDATGGRATGSTIINNSIAWFEPSTGPDPLAIDFWDQRKACFEPRTANSLPSEFYWMKDGIAIDGIAYLFAARFESIVARRGVAMITMDPNDQNPTNSATQVEVPLFAPADANHAEITYGGAFFDNSVEAGAPNPDGYVYCYGVEEIPGNKYALVARVPRVQFTDFSAWTFWDGAGWSSSIHDSARVAERVSTEMSVTALPNGKYVMVFMLDTISGTIAYRLADSPEGPWGPHVEVYDVPIPPTFPNVFAYHAKAHPHLSEPGSLLVSYNVNTLAFNEHLRFADIYRPRFIRLTQ